MADETKKDEGKPLASSLSRSFNPKSGQRPSTSNPTPRIEPGRVESIGPQNLKNNVTEAKKANLQLGGAEGDKQKEDAAKKAAENNPTTPSSIISDKK